MLARLNDRRRTVSACPWRLDLHPERHGWNGGGGGGDGNARRGTAQCGRRARVRKRTYTGGRTADRMVGEKSRGREEQWSRLLINARPR